MRLRKFCFWHFASSTSIIRIPYKQCICAYYKQAQTHLELFHSEDHADQCSTQCTKKEMNRIQYICHKIT